jgi:hypothetical protein
MKKKFEFHLTHRKSLMTPLEVRMGLGSLMLGRTRRSVRTGTRVCPNNYIGNELNPHAAEVLKETWDPHSGILKKNEDHAAL